MNIEESFQSALQSIKSNKLRSFLTMLGIIIGISSVITIVSIGAGAKQYITGQFQGMGSNVINVQLNRSSSNPIEKRDYFTMDDLDLIKNKIPEVTSVVPMLSGDGNLKVENKSKLAQVVASTEGYDKLSNIKMINGRFLSEHDVDIRSNAAIIDEKTAQKLFHSTDVDGEDIELSSDYGDINLNIVGVCKDPNGNLGSSSDNTPGEIFMPITSADRILKNTDISYMSVMLSDMSNADEISSKMIKILENKHQNKNMYTAQTGFKELESLNTVLTTITGVLGAIAAISLLVGGIGVMNIMLVSVTERTREIGIRKAIGAKTRDIKVQFLMESIILCLIGGTIGTILGITIGKIAGSLLKMQVPVSFKIIFIAFSFSSAIGIFFGLYPASKAAKLDPIEALRYE
ncbi:putative ABC transport system permease protein [Clostridium algifaecis]|uniref:ABC transport system permease protein n=1 Tax=Clostridium algifaecis TaxID=1472040 RepID=A0ABS4KTA9_9CLOT|nr:ABC transporter permease [Clostridium algifaecis]MBP2033285.1 putative ABC transport system permease protein [Clostridium algifaecis]